jgi:pimeloyl-ACP methyl ester carboxylesterase
VALACAAGLLVAVPTAPSQAVTTTTSTKERQRVDRVKAKITWNKNCGTNVKCGYIKLPLDYDSPKKATVTVQLARYRYPGQTKRIGTLFVNPGGPGNSAISFVKAAKTYFPVELLKRFDIVGIDPRGVGQSSTVQCFSTYSKRRSALGSFDSVAFPSKSEVSAYVKGAVNFAKACSSTQKTKASAMSTAEAARDMDVIRRAVGDSKLSYLGFSYGTYLGEVYAAMFPNRIRVMVLDSVINPSAWRGSQSTKNTPVTMRIKAGESSYQTLVAAMNDCKKAGAPKCPIMPDPLGAFQTVVSRLKSRSVTSSSLGTVTYAGFINTTASYLRAPKGGEDVAKMVSQLLVLTSPKSTAAEIKAADNGLSGLTMSTDATGFAAYDTYLDSYYSVMCSDSTNAANPYMWSSKISSYSGAAKDFVALWGWNSVPCASSYWKAKDEDRFTGTFSVRTSYPVLAVNNRYDPVTGISGAKALQKLFQNSRLLVSESYGHLSYIYSSCVEKKVNSYLISRTLPANTSCANERPIFAS